MVLQVNIRQIGDKGRGVAPVAFEYPFAPKTVGELIAETVKLCVSDFNRRVSSGENRVRPLTKEKLTDMASVGKIAFGLSYNDKEQPLEPAVKNALESFEDGLYRVFLNDNELERLEDKLDISENDTLTFIRLTMLSGRMW